MIFTQEVNIYSSEAIIKRFRAVDTSLQVVQGKISAILTDSEILELQNSKTTMYSKLANVELKVDSLTLNFSDLTTKYNSLTGKYDSLDSKVADYKLGVDGLSADISATKQNLKDNYSTTSAMNTAISASVNGFKTEVSNTYATKTSMNTAKQDAINSANTATDNKLKGYSTTVQMNSEINQKVDSITSTVDARFKSYSTTLHMNTIIDQKGDSILSTGSATYATKTETNTLKSQINQQATMIESKVTKNEFGSYVQQYYDKVIYGFNNSSKYLQISTGQIGIYDYGITDSKKRAVFDENGNHFYRDGYYVGAIGTNSYASDTSKKGLVFDLESQGAYMTWANKQYSSDSTYIMRWTFSNKYVGANMTPNTLYAGCSINVNGFQLMNAQLTHISAQDGYLGWTGKIPIVASIRDAGNGSIEWTTSSIDVSNGIITASPR